MDKSRLRERQTREPESYVFDPFAYLINAVFYDSARKKG